MKTICIMCPNGCELDIKKDKQGNVTVSGNTCPRGAEYGKQEILLPTRIVTSIIKTNDGTISVKTSKPIPKDKIFDVLAEIKQFSAKNASPKVKVNQIIIEKPLGIDTNIVVTGTHKE